MKVIDKVLSTSGSKQKYIIAGIFVFVGFILAQLTPIIITLLLLGIFSVIGYVAYKWFAELNKKIKSQDD